MGSLTPLKYDIRVKTLEYLISQDKGKTLKEIARIIFPNDILTADLRRKVFASLQRISKLNHIEYRDNSWHKKDTASEYLEYLRKNKDYIVRSP